MQTTHPLKNSRRLNYESPKILVVDDDITTLRIVKKYLTDAGIGEVEILSDSQDAISTIHSFRPKMILLDIFMPQVDGLTLLQEIRSTPDFDSIIVLMLSTAGKQERFQSLEMGAMGFIQKPVTKETLVEDVQKAIRVANRFGAC